MEHPARTAIPGWSAAHARGGVDRLFAGPGEMRAFCRGYDWAATSLGPVDAWPQSLRTAVDLCLGSAFACFVWWGTDLLQIYNDAGLAIARGKHPLAFATSASQAWSDVWDVARPMVEHVVATGEAVSGEDLEVGLARGGPDQQAYFTFSFSALHDETGAVAGVFVIAIETTAKVQAERRQQAVIARLREANEEVARSLGRMRESEDRYRTLFESIDEGFCLIEVQFDDDGAASDYRFLEANPAFERHTGIPDPIGRTIRELVPGHEAHWFEIFGQVARTGVPARFEETATALGRDYDVYAFRLGAPELRRVAILFSDVTERRRTEAALRESEARYRTLADLSPDASWVNLDGKLVYANQTAARVMGAASAEELIGRQALDIVEPEYRDFLRDRAMRLLATGGTAGVTEMRWRRLDGSVIDVESTASLIPWAGRTAIQVVFRDVTARKRAEREERALREREARLAAALEAERTALLEEVFRWAPSFLHVLRGPAMVIEFANEAYHRLVGHRDVIGRPAFEAMPEARAGGYPSRIAHVMATGEPFYGRELPVTLARTPGAPPEVRLIDVVYLPLIDADGTCTRVLGHGTDVTDHVRARRHAEAERDAVRRQLSAAEEDERRRLARELHDQLGQHLTALALGLTEVHRLLDAGLSAKARLAQLDDLAQLMTRDARYLALELRPPELDDVGLESAIASYVEQWRTRYGVDAEVAITGVAAERPLPPELGTAIYRIVQEALTNVARHAKARQASVMLGKDESEVRLIVEDDGRGFDLDATMDLVRRQRRLGLAGMRERAALVGGTLEVETRPGSGTTIYVRMPLERS
jgi:PAS domain S-box-containing protein